MTLNIITSIHYDVVPNGVTNKFSFVHKGKKGYHHTFVSKWGLWGSNKNKSEKRTRKKKRKIKLMKREKNMKEEKRGLKNHQSSKSRGDFWDWGANLNFNLIVLYVYTVVHELI